MPALGVEGFRRLVSITSVSGETAEVVIVSGVRRLAVDSSLSWSGEIQIGAVELDDAATETRASIKPDAAVISASGQDGGIMIAGRDPVSGIQRHVRVDASGNLVTATAAGAAGTTQILAEITSGQFGPSANIFASGAAIAPRAGVSTVEFLANEAEVLSLSLIRNATTRTGELNNGASIGSGRWQAFDFPVRSGDNLNLRLSASGTVTAMFSFRDV